MVAALLVVFLAENPPASLPRIADDATLVRALDRSQRLGDRLLAELPETFLKGPRTRVAQLLDDVNRDRQRLAREGHSPVFEAGVFFVYSELFQLGTEHLGTEGLQLSAVRSGAGGEVRSPTAAAIGRTGRTAFTHTLFTYEELQDIGRRSQELLQALSKHEKVDPYRNAKWKRNLAALRVEVTRAVDELRMPAQPFKIIPEARLLGSYAKLVSDTVNAQR